MSSREAKSYDDIRRKWEKQQQYLAEHEKRKQAFIEEYNRKKMSQRREKESRSRRSSQSGRRRSSSPSRRRSSSSVSERRRSRSISNPPAEPDFSRETVERISNFVREQILLEMAKKKSGQPEDTTSQTRQGDRSSRTTEREHSRNLPSIERRSSRDPRDPQPSTSGRSSRQHAVNSSSLAIEVHHRSHTSNREHGPSHNRRSSRDLSHTTGDSRRNNGNSSHRNSSSRDRDFSHSHDRGHNRKRGHSRDRSRSREHSRCRSCGHHHRGLCRERQGDTHSSPRRSGGSQLAIRDRHSSPRSSENSQLVRRDRGYMRPRPPQPEWNSYGEGPIPGPHPVYVQLAPYAPWVRAAPRPVMYPGGPYWPPHPHLPLPPPPGPRGRGPRFPPGHRQQNYRRRN